MSTQLKTRLAVRGSGPMMAEKMMIGKRMLNFEFTVMRESDYTEYCFLAFKLDIRFLGILKLLHIYLFWGIDNLISGQWPLFYQRKYRSIAKEHLPEIDPGTSFFLVQTLKKILYTWRMTCKFCWFYQPNLVGIWGNTVSKMEKLD